MDRPDLIERNRIAREADAYRTWTVRYGLPEAAAEIARDPRRVARRALPHLGDPVGLTVANPLGSRGRLATALAPLGARVSVFDLSASNARSARELAAAAGVRIEYPVGETPRRARRRVPACGGRLRLLACTEDRSTIEAIPAHLATKTPAPSRPPRSATYRPNAPRLACVIGCARLGPTGGTAPPRPARSAVRLLPPLTLHPGPHEPTTPAR